MPAGHSRTVSQEELLRAAPGSNINVTNPIFREFGSTGAAQPACVLTTSPALLQYHKDMALTGGSEHVELVEGLVVEDLQAEKVSLPLEEGSVLLVSPAGVVSPVAAPDSPAARSCGSKVAAKAGKAKKRKEKKQMRKAEWVSVMDAPQQQQRGGSQQVEAASRCTSTASYYTTNGGDAGEAPTPNAPLNETAARSAEVRLITHYQQTLQCNAPWCAMHLPPDSTHATPTKFHAALSGDAWIGRWRVHSECHARN